jgi:hypothetical protein
LGINVDEAFFLGGVEKTKILKAFNPHIFFDDQDVHLEPASVYVLQAEYLMLLAHHYISKYCQSSQLNLCQCHCPDESGRNYHHGHEFFSDDSYLPKIVLQ